MARQPNTTQSRKVEPTIPVGAYAHLERLAREGVIGTNPTEVARFLIIASLKEMQQKGELPKREAE